MAYLEHQSFLLSLRQELVGLIHSAGKGLLYQKMDVVLKKFSGYLVMEIGGHNNTGHLYCPEKLFVIAKILQARATFFARFRSVSTTATSCASESWANMRAWTAPKLPTPTTPTFSFSIA